jgi:hypothetical protein
MLNLAWKKCICPTPGYTVAIYERKRQIILTDPNVLSKLT